MIRNLLPYAVMGFLGGVAVKCLLTFGFGGSLWWLVAFVVTWTGICALAVREVRGTTLSDKSE